MRASQPALALRPSELMTLDNFQTSDAGLKPAIEQADHLYLWGGSGCGKSHLLQALVLRSIKAGERAIWMPLAQYAQGGAPTLDALQDCALIALDDLEQLRHNRPLQETLVHTYNSGGARIAVSAACPPARLGLPLADLQSRLQRFLVLQLRELGEQDKYRLIMRRAASRGIRLDEPVLRYLLNRESRDMHRLLGCLERLDAASLSSKRKLTIPLIKEVMKW